MKNLIEYYWNEETQTAEFLYEYETCTGISTTVEYKPAPIKVQKPSLEIYWSQLKRWLDAESPYLEFKRAG